MTRFPAGWGAIPMGEMTEFLALILPGLSVPGLFAHPQTAPFLSPAGVEMRKFLCHVQQNNEFFLNSGTCGRWGIFRVEKIRKFVENSQKRLAMWEI